MKWTRLSLIHVCHTKIIDIIFYKPISRHVCIKDGLSQHGSGKYFKQNGNFHILRVKMKVWLLSLWSVVHVVTRFIVPRKIAWNTRLPITCKLLYSMHRAWLSGINGVMDNSNMLGSNLDWYRWIALMNLLLYYLWVIVFIHFIIHGDKISPLLYLMMVWTT